MSKKVLLVSVCFVLLLILSGCSNTEKENSKSQVFVLRNGIKFGDTVDEVRAKETTLTFDSHLPVNDENEFEQLCYKGTISGIEESTADFVFVDGKLVSMLYTLGDGSVIADSDDGGVGATLHRLKRAAVQEAYGNIQAGLTDKYGSPLSQSCDYYGKKLKGIIEGSVIRALMGMRPNYDSLNYNEWFYQIGKDYVKIDQMIIFDDEGWYGDYDHYVEYTFFSHEEITENSLENINNYNELANDL